MNKRKVKKVVLSATYYDRKSAERAASVLRGKRVAAEVVEVEIILCPGSVRKKGLKVQVLVGDCRLAERYLKEA